MGPIGKSAPISIVRRAPPTASCSLVSPHRKRTKPSPSLFRSTEERRTAEACSSFRSREQPHAGLTTVVLGRQTSASLKVLPLGSLRGQAVARVGVVGPKQETLRREFTSGCRSAANFGRPKPSSRSVAALAAGRQSCGTRPPVRLSASRNHRTSSPKSRRPTIRLPAHTQNPPASASTRPWGGSRMPGRLGTARPLPRVRRRRPRRPP